MKKKKKFYNINARIQPIMYKIPNDMKLSLRPIRLEATPPRGQNMMAAIM